MGGSLRFVRCLTANGKFLHWTALTRTGKNSGTLCGGYTVHRFGHARVVDTGQPRCPRCDKMHDRAKTLF